MFEREFFDESINKFCKLLIVKDKISEKYLETFLTKYLNTNKKKIMSFDLEFNTPPGSHKERVIAIFQIAFYLKNYVLIIFFNPILLNKNNNNLIKKLLISKNILKIGHGTDSLDVPAIFMYLDTDDDRISFINTLYDTRFLCEYENVITESKLCNIYYLLEKYSVLTPEQMNFLIINEQKIGKFWMNKIDLKNLSPELRDYSMYDALYLKKLLGSIKRDFKKLNYNYKLIIEATRFIFLLKREIIKIYNFGSLNIYFLSDKKRLYEHFIEFYNQFNENLFKVNYFKSSFIKILQLAFYIQICKENKVYQSNNNLINNSVLNNLENIWKNLSIYLKLYPKINKLIIKFLEFCQTRI